MHHTRSASTRALFTDQNLYAECYQSRSRSRCVCVLKAPRSRSWYRWSASGARAFTMFHAQHNISLSAGDVLVTSVRVCGLTMRTHSSQYSCKQDQ